MRSRRARNPASGLAEELKLNSDALERLLDACVGLQLLERAGGLYKNTAAASAYLCKQSPSRLTGYINYSNAILWKLWGNLEDAIREGTNRWQQTFGWDGPIFSNFFRTEESMREFLMAMHGYGLISSPHVVAAFDLSGFRRLIDLGGATGHLAIAACQRYPGMRAAVFDLPDAAPLAREIVSASTVADRIEIVLGRLFRRSASRRRPLRTGPNTPRLDRSQGPDAARAHLRPASVGRRLADRRKADFGRPDRPSMGSHAEPGDAALHGRERAHSHRISSTSRASRFFRRCEARPHLHRSMPSWP